MKLSEHRDDMFSVVQFRLSPHRARCLLFFVTFQCDGISFDVIEFRVASSFHRHVVYRKV